MDVIGQLRKGLFFGISAGVFIYVAFSLYAEVDAVWADLRAFRWLLLAPVLCLSLLNYAVRLARWQYYLRELRLEVPWGDSARVFLAGLSMTLTPGKVGELLKSLLLKERCGVPLTRSAPVVVAERVTDLLALVVLAGLGVGAFYAEGTWTVGVVGLVLGGVVALIQQDRWIHALLDLFGRVGRLGPVVGKARELYGSAKVLLGVRPLLVGLVLGLVSWGMECAGLWVVLVGSGVDAGLLQAGFIYAFSTVAGVVSPGGLGVTDGLLVVLTTRLLPGTPRSVAVAAAFVIRLSTLWFAVGLGSLMLLRFPPGSGTKSAVGGVQT